MKETMFRSEYVTPRAVPVLIGTSGIICGSVTANKAEVDEIQNVNIGDDEKFEIEF